MTLNGSASAEVSSAGLTSVRVGDKRIESDGVVSLLLEHPRGARLPDWSPGAHVDLLLPHGEVRQYSLCGDRWDAFRYRVAVLREPTGRGGSAYIHDHLSPGDEIQVGGPRNNFAVVPSRRYIFIAGGIGITPLVPMIDQASRLGADWRMVYGARNRRAMAFADELLDRHGSRIELVPHDEQGPIDLSFLKVVDSEAAVYACGPVPLLDAVTAATADWPVGRVRMERFTPKEQPAPVLDGPFLVELARSGRTVTVPPHRSVLEAVRTAGVPVLTSCEQGTCGTCETAVLGGVPDHRDSIYNDFERAGHDRMFICVSRSCTKRLVLDL